MSAQHLITAEDHIIINKSQQAVFEYIANLDNDKNWRTEITATETSSATPSLNTTATEHSYLSKKLPDHVNHLQCTALNPGNAITYQTINNSKYYLQSSRTVQPVGNNSCRVAYSIEFDPGIVKQAIGIQLPKWLVKWKTKSDMKKYMANLKAVLEN